jgi:hypothetical protein
MASNYSDVGQNLGQFPTHIGFDLQHQLRADCEHGVFLMGVLVLPLLPRSMKPSRPRYFSSCLLTVLLLHPHFRASV